jgi:hypothetical protein
MSCFDGLAARNCDHRRQVLNQKALAKVAATLVLLLGGALIFVNATPPLSIPNWSQLLFQRLVGRSPSAEEWNTIKNLIADGKQDEALDSMTRKNDFINLTARAFCQPMSTRSELPDGTMNEFTASCMGTIRDDRPATEFLNGNYWYEFSRTPENHKTSVTDWLARQLHYDSMEGQDINGYDYAQLLIRREGQVVPKLPSDPFSIEPITEAVPQPQPAGLLTTSSWSKEHGVEGTNRRMVEFAFREFLCRPIADFADTTASDAWVGRDVNRTPGGNGQIFQTTCRGCHSLLDGMRGAFAYSTWSQRGQISLIPPASAKLEVAEKYARNWEVHPAGHVTNDDSWQNLAVNGSNADYFGWRGATSGRGASEFGAMLARAKAFSKCMVQRTIQTVCLREATFEDLDAIILPEANKLEADNYNLRHLFSRVAANAKCIQPSQE